MRLLAWCALCLCGLLPGCGDFSNGDLEFRYALPSPGALAAKVPGTASAKGALSQRRDGLALGEPSAFYADTRAASERFNGLLFDLLGILEQVSSARPSERSEDRRVWGPFPDEQDLRNHVRVVIERGGALGEAQAYSWRIEIKRRTSAPDAWLEVVAGSYLPTADLRKGAGFFVLDAQRVREAGFGRRDDDGKLQRLQMEYVTDQDPITVRMALVSVDGELEYAYQERPDQSGSIRFDLTPAPGAGYERGTSISRWSPKGAGRADVTVTGGTWGSGQATAIECWDEAFVLVYGRPFAYPTAPEVGVLAECAFVGGP